MLRCLVTKHVPRLICIAALVCLLGTLPGELSIRFEIDPGVPGDPASRARDPTSRARDTTMIANVLSKLRPIRMRSS
jgi:hypothetical protein